jgi:hypothetical protein
MNSTDGIFGCYRRQEVYYSGHPNFLFPEDLTAKHK